MTFDIDLFASQAYNDETRNPVIARHEAIQKQSTQSGLLRSARNDKHKETSPCPPPPAPSKGGE